MTTAAVERECVICGASLEGRRADALTCGGAHRAELSRLRRLLGGQEVDGYRSLADRQARRRKRTERADAAQGAP